MFHKVGGRLDLPTEPIKPDFFNKVFRIQILGASNLPVGYTLWFVIIAVLT